MIRAIRNGLIAVAIAAALPTTGLGTQAFTLAMELKEDIAAAADRVASNWITDFTAPGVRLREAAGTGSAIVGHGNPGDGLTTHQKVIGEPVRCPDGTTNSDWFEITNARTSAKGFASACHLG